MQERDPEVGDERPGEAEWGRLDRNWQEMLQELRVAQAGVQILFAFLLSLPFTQRWTLLDDFGRAVYTVTLLLAAAASALLIGPVAYHRLVFRQHARARLVKAGNAMAVAGLLVLALAMCSAVLLITSFLFDPAVSAVITTAAALMFGTLWGVLPLVGRHEQRQERAERASRQRREAGGPPGR